MKKSVIRYRQERMRTEKYCSECESKGVRKNQKKTGKGEI